MKRQYISVALPVMAMFFIVLQYSLLQINLIFSGAIVYNQPSEEQMASLGSERYFKDIWYLITAVIWPVLVYRSSQQSAKRFMFVVFLAEAVLVFLGVVPHAISPDVQLMVAGFRWLVLLHNCLGFVCLALAIDFWKGGGKVLNRTVWAILITCILIAVFQAIVFGEFSGRVRYQSLFANSLSFGYALIGIALYLMVVPGISVFRTISGMALTIVGAALSGSRGPIIIILVILVVYVSTVFLDRTQKKEDRVVILGLLVGIIPAFMLIAYFVASILSTRGDVLSDQIGEGGRISNYISFFRDIGDAGLIDMLIGKGFGYGTNTAAILYPDLIEKTPWMFPIDNTYIAIFQQMGIVGVVIFTIITLLFFLWVSKQGHSIVYSLKLGMLVLVYLAMTVNQNFFESHLLMVLYFLAIAALVNDDRLNYEMSGAG